MAPLSDSTNFLTSAPRPKHTPITVTRPRTAPRRSKPPFAGVEEAAQASESPGVLDEALSALRREQAESRRLRVMLEEARANEAHMRRQMQAAPVLVEPVAARPGAPGSPSHSPQSEPSSSKEPTTPIWLREAASTLGSLARPEIQPVSTSPEGLDGIGGAQTPGGRSEVSIEYLKVWLVPYLAQVYGGAARESHAALARVLVSMLHLPTREAAHLNAMMSGDPSRPAAPGPRGDKPSMWNLLTCSGAAALDAVRGGPNLAEEERRLVAESVSRWW